MTGANTAGRRPLVLRLRAGGTVMSSTADRSVLPPTLRLSSDRYAPIGTSPLVRAGTVPAHGRGGHLVFGVHPNGRKTLRSLV